MVRALAIAYGRGMPPSRDAVSEFWNWFVSASTSLREGNGHAALQSVNGRMKELGIAVSAEIETAKQEWRLVITADGDHTRFTEVIRIVKAAPTVPRWSVIAFRQRVPLRGKTIKMDGVSMECDRARVTVRVHGDRVDVQLYLPDFADGNETIRRIGRVALDNAVGEFDAETRIGEITSAPLIQAPSSARPLPELPTILDAALPIAN